MSWLSNVGKAFNSAIDNAVSDAKNRWTAITTPSTAKTIIGAGIEAVKTYKGLSTPSTAAATQQKVAQLKSTAQQQLEQVKQRSTKEYQQQMEFAGKHGGVFGKTLVRAVHEYPLGLIGTRPYDIDVSTGNKAADVISSLVGGGLGFITGGGVSGAAKVGKLAAKGVTKALPFLSKNTHLIPKVASSIVKGAVREGVEGTLLSGIHSILNADTKEEAIARAKEYGLYGALFGGTLHGAGVALTPAAKAIGKKLKSVGKAKAPDVNTDDVATNLLAEMAKRLKGVVTSDADTIPLKNYVDPEFTRTLPKVSDMELDSVKSIARNISKTTGETVESTVNILKHVIDNAKDYSPKAVGEAKMTLVDIMDKMQHIALGNKLEMGDELFPELEGLISKTKGKILKPQEVPIGKNVVLRGKYGEKIKTMIDPVQGTSDEFWFNYMGQRQWGKTDYWDIVQEPTKFKKKSLAKKEVAKKEVAKKEVVKKEVVKKEVVKKEPTKKEVAKKEPVKKTPPKPTLEEKPKTPKPKVAKETPKDTKLKEPSKKQKEAEEEARKQKEIEEKAKRISQRFKESEKAEELAKKSKTVDKQPKTTVKQPEQPAKQPTKQPTKQPKKQMSKEPISKDLVPKGKYEFIDTTPVREVMERPDAPTTRKGKKLVKRYAEQQRTEYSGKEDVNAMIANDLARDIELFDRKVKGKLDRNQAINMPLKSYLEAGGGRLSDTKVSANLQESLAKVQSKLESAKTKKDKAALNTEKAVIKRAMNLSDDAKQLSKRAIKFFDEHEDYAKHLGISSGQELADGTRGFLPYGVTDESGNALKNISSVIKEYGQQRASKIAKAEFLNQSTLIKKVAPGEPPPEGYAIIKTDTFGNLAAPEHMKDRLKMLFDDGMITKARKESKVLDKFIDTQQFIRQQKLSLDVWNQFDMYLKHLANNVLGLKRLIGARKPKLEVAEKFGIENLLSSRYMKQDSEAYKEVRKILVRDGGLMTSLVRKGAEENVKFEKILGSKKLGRLEERLMERAFDKTQERFKVNDAWHNVQTWLARHPTATEAEYLMAMRKICKHTNDAYHGLNLKALGISKTTMEVARLFHLAPEWRLAGLRMGGRALKGDPKAIGYMITSLVGIYGLISQGLNVAFTGHTTFDNEEGKKWMVNIGNGMYVSVIPSALRDIVNPLAKIDKEGLLKGTGSYAAAQMFSAPILSELKWSTISKGYKKDDGLMTQAWKSFWNVTESVIPLGVMEYLKVGFTKEGWDPLTALPFLTGIPTYREPKKKKKQLKDPKKK